MSEKMGGGQPRPIQGLDQPLIPGRNHVLLPHREEQALKSEENGYACMQLPASRNIYNV